MWLAKDMSEINKRTREGLLFSTAGGRVDKKNRELERGSVIVNIANQRIHMS